jgi:organic radical activating enzyme
MQIHNIRLGFATNSSSSHSIIIIPKDTAVPANDDSSDYFGWDNFTLSSDESKIEYLASLAAKSFYELSDSNGAILANVLLGRAPTDDIREIDHQSNFPLPKNRLHLGIDEEFLSELKNFFLRKDVVILGGNDDDGAHVLEYAGRHVGIQRLLDKKIFARKDKKYNYWTLFSPDDGTKVRISFDNFEQIQVKKAYAPELVDIKITDFCTKGCAYCYQSSTPSGSHADLMKIYELAQTLGSLGTFEVAIGGGEPADYPYFTETVEAFRAQGIVPNFTTRSVNWLYNDEIRGRVLKTIGAFAFSVDSAEEAEKLRDICVKKQVDLSKVNFQYVVGSGDKYAFERIVDFCSKNNHRLVLLGFKNVGRGTTFKLPQYYPMPKGHWLSYIKKVHKKDGIMTSIDTALALESKLDLEKEKIPNWSYHTDEGTFSMYVDAVNMKVGRSSYHLNDLVSVKNFYDKTILDKFALWQPDDYSNIKSKFKL